MFSPKLAMRLTEIVDPSVQKFTTLTLPEPSPLEPLPITEKLEPKRTKLRTESDEPTDKKSVTLADIPRRACDLIESEEPSDR